METEKTVADETARKKMTSEQRLPFAFYTKAKGVERVAEDVCEALVRERDSIGEDLLVEIGEVTPCSNGARVDFNVSSATNKIVDADKTLDVVEDVDGVERAILRSGKGRSVRATITGPHID